MKINKLKKLVREEIENDDTDISDNISDIASDFANRINNELKKIKTDEGLETAYIVIALRLSEITNYKQIIKKLKNLNSTIGI